MHKPGRETVGTYTPDRLSAGSDIPVAVETIVLAAGQVLKRGALLGRITAEGATKGQYALSVAAAGDGSQEPVCVLAEDTDASAAATRAPANFTGAFNERAIVFGAGHTAATAREGLRQKNIYLRSSVKG